MKVIEDNKEYYVIKTSNSITYYYIDVLHRELGPAVEYLVGYKTKFWYKYGKLHREDGPAIIFYNIDYKEVKEYWLNGTHYPNIESVEELLLASII
jgi:hypothetical protein